MIYNAQKLDKLHWELKNTVKGFCLMQFDSMIAEPYVMFKNDSVYKENRDKIKQTLKNNGFKFIKYDGFCNTVYFKEATN